MGKIGVNQDKKCPARWKFFPLNAKIKCLTCGVEVLDGNTPKCLNKKSGIIGFIEQLFKTN